MITSNLILGPMLTSQHWHTILLISGGVYCGGAALIYSCLHAKPDSTSRSPAGSKASGSTSGAGLRVQPMASLATLLHVTATTPRILLALAIAGVRTCSPLENTAKSAVPIADAWCACPHRY